MPTLFDEDSDKEELKGLNVNTDYAKTYDSWRKKEEIHKLKTKYGEDAVNNLNYNDDDDEDDESSSSSDDEGEEIPEDFEKNFYKTLACLKNKDPKIYNENVKFFNDAGDQKEESESKKIKKEKAMTLRDYERKIIIEKGGKLSDSEDEEAGHSKSYDPTYVEEQQALKDSLKNAVYDDDDNDADDLLKPKTKSSEEKHKEEEAYKEWLKGQAKEINEEEQKALKPLRDFWTDPKLDENEKFLRDYILNKKFLGNDDDDYDHEYSKKIHDSDDNLSEDEKNIDKQEEFEHKYNFRYEEPDPEFLKRYPRTLEGTYRQKETKRAEIRAEVKARKEQEKLKKREELKQLKAMKRKEIEEKLDKLKEITGNDDIKLDLNDLDGDFNPEEYDRKMSAMFNDDYYAHNEDEMKPEFPEIDEELEVEQHWDFYDPNSEVITDGQHCEDPEFNMDADYDGSQRAQNGEAESVSKKKRRRRNKFAELISKEKPKFDPKKYPQAQKYFDQYYALDYEDMIGDLPCRFKYRETVPNDYGLTVEEILLADDKELNRWISLKRALQRKDDETEYNDVRKYKQKAANEDLKRKYLPSLYKPLEEEQETNDKEEPEENVEQKSNKKKRRKKKKPQENKEAVVAESEKVKAEIGEEPSDNKADVGEAESNENNHMVAESKNKKKRKREKSMIENDKNKTDNKADEPSVEQSLVNGEEPAKKKKKKKKESAEEQVSEPPADKPQPIVKGDQTQEKKKKKKKKESAKEQVSKPPAGKPQPIVNGDQTQEKKNKKKNKKKAKTEVPEKKKLHVSESFVEELSKKKGENLKKKEIRKEVFKKRAKAKLSEEEAKKNPILQLKNERLKAYGIKNPNKFKNKLKYIKKK